MTALVLELELILRYDPGVHTTASEQNAIHCPYCTHINTWMPSQFPVGICAAVICSTWFKLAFFPTTPLKLSWEGQSLLILLNISAAFDSLKSFLLLPPMTLDTPGFPLISVAALFQSLTKRLPCYLLTSFTTSNARVTRYGCVPFYSLSSLPNRTHPFTTVLNIFDPAYQIDRGAAKSVESGARLPGF